MTVGIRWKRCQSLTWCISATGQCQSLGDRARRNSGRLLSPVAQRMRSRLVIGNAPTKTCGVGSMRTTIPTENDTASVGDERVRNNSVNEYIHTLSSLRHASTRPADSVVTCEPPHRRPTPEKRVLRCNRMYHFMLFRMSPRSMCAQRITSVNHAEC